MRGSHPLLSDSSDDHWRRPSVSSLAPWRYGQHLHISPSTKSCFSGRLFTASKLSTFDYIALASMNQSSHVNLNSVVSFIHKNAMLMRPILVPWRWRVAHFCGSKSPGMSSSGADHPSTPSLASLFDLFQRKWSCFSMRFLPEPLQRCQMSNFWSNRWIPRKNSKQ